LAAYAACKKGSRSENDGYDTGVAGIQISSDQERGLSSFRISWTELRIMPFRDARPAGAADNPLYPFGCGVSYSTFSFYRLAGRWRILVAREPGPCSGAGLPMIAQ
jgi:hypothetical protein